MIRNRKTHRLTRNTSIKAHKDVFVNGDPEAGVPTPHVRDIHIYDSTKLDVDEILSKATIDIIEYSRIN